VSAKPSARARAARAMLRMAFLIIRPKRFYEPVQIGGRRYVSKRDSEIRWKAIADAIQRYGARNILDIGCAEGWFIRRAAAEFSCFGIGVEAAERRLLLGEIARLHDGAERIATMKVLLTPEDIMSLPVCDLMLCLSVVHHVFRQGGQAAADQFVSALATRVGKAMLFEMGTADEKKLRWSAALPDMPDGQEAFVRRLLGNAGLVNIKVIAATPGLRKDAPRLLFSAEPAGVIA
jgi:SAM-dependent methyltransferase